MLLFVLFFVVGGELGREFTANFMQTIQFNLQELERAITFLGALVSRRIVRIRFLDDKMKRNQNHNMLQQSK